MIESNIFCNHDHRTGSSWTVIEVWYTQADIIEALISISRYLDDLLKIDNLYFEQMVCQVYKKNS